MLLPDRIGIVGVGYVGLPLAFEFSKAFSVTAFDISERRVQELRDGIDRTGEVSKEDLRQAKIQFTAEPMALQGISFFVVTVPTPIDEFARPDLSPLLGACQVLAPVLKPGSIVVFESTVYPGLTEEVLAPELERLTKLRFNKDFFLGYSPERINPGDKEHTLPRIKKIVSGSTPETLEVVSGVYSKIITAGVHPTSSIAVAEAAKVIENTQRDVNVALINEIAMLCDRLNLDVYDVLEAAGTKWNFLKFKPGLVGGHCIGVDPYYLTHKARQVGFHTAMILAGRRTNDGMSQFFADKVLRQLVLHKVSPLGARILVLGFTFKENCPDVRNTKIFDLVKSLERYGIVVDVVDPVADIELAKEEYGQVVTREVKASQKYDACLLAVSHQPVLASLEKAESWLQVSSEGFVFDLKGALAGRSVLGKNGAVPVIR